MKWFKRKLRSYLESVMYDSIGIDSTNLKITKETNRPDTEPVLNFRVYSAENGRILEFNKYDRVKDRTDTRIYIIGKDEEISNKVSKCLSLELLR
jgi:hypothetical protein